MNRTSRLPIIFIATLLGALVLSACGASNAAPTPAPDKVNVQLGWTYEFSTAEFYAAEKNGRFAAQNLAVNLQQGGFVNGAYVDTIADVLSGKSDFGLTDDITLLQARADGKPMVALATMMQRSPSAVISLPKANIHHPQDLVGKKVAVADGGARALFITLLTTANVDPSQVTIVPRTTFGVDPLVKGDVDALVGWIMNEGVQVKQAGFAPDMMLLSDYGIESYTNVLIATEQTVKNKPQIVQRFVMAVTQGLQDVVSNPDQAVTYTLAYGTTLTKDNETLGLTAMLPLVAPVGSKPGMMDDATWKATYQMVTDQKLISKPFDVSTAYTFNFLNQVYSKQ
ncbi:MAG TPA: ABC transporter substrate-binding protein [Aggregatilineales bacterium]|nr:ABC transporter substrate-binding protein [Aggregatilineales bacterium]